MQKSTRQNRKALPGLWSGRRESNPVCAAWKAGGAPCARPRDLSRQGLTGAGVGALASRLPAPPPAPVEPTLAEFETWLYAARLGDDGNFSEHRTEIEQALFALWRFREASK